MTGEGPLRVYMMEVGPLAVNAFLVEHAKTRNAVVIDPGGDGEAILGEMARLSLTVTKILLTHGHFDHVGAVRLLREKTGAPVHLHPADVSLMTGASRQGMMFGLSLPDPPPPDVLVEEGSIVRLEEQEFLVAHTPGHTPGCVSYIVGKMAFVGDLIFAGSIGRTDLPGGDHEQLIESVRRKIFPLPGETVLFPGHGPATTVEGEKRSNPFF